MTYMILDSAGNALASFDDELTARATMLSMATLEPDAADHMALLEYDDEGMPVGQALSIYDLEPAVTVAPSEFVRPSIRTSVVAVMAGRFSKSAKYFGGFETRDRVIRAR